MIALFAALAIGIVSYIIFNVMFPKAVQDESGNFMAQALDRLYEENRTQESSSGNVLREQLSEEHPLVRHIFSLRATQPMYELAIQAGYAGHLHMIIIMFLGFGFGVFLFLSMIGQTLLAIIAFPVGGYVLTARQCRKKIAARNRKFLDQFPDALDMIVRSVKSGFPLSVALQMLSENTEDPLRSEFRQVVDEVTAGRPLSQALSRLALRVNESDIRFFVVVLTVQQETGGNLAEIIGNLSNVLRKRKQLRHKIKAMTSEGRATGLILGGLPVLVFFALYFIQPDYLNPFFYDPLGHMILGSCIALLFICYLVVKQMINVDL